MKLKELKGCGKKVEWFCRYYSCGEFEDLKHQDHIILCSICKAKLQQHKETSKAKDKEWAERSADTQNLIKQNEKAEKELDEAIKELRK